MPRVTLKIVKRKKVAKRARYRRRRSGPHGRLDTVRLSRLDCVIWHTAYRWVLHNQLPLYFLISIARKMSFFVIGYKFQCIMTYRIRQCQAI